jgi:hypothetical protein
MPSVDSKNFVRINPVKTKMNQINLILPNIVTETEMETETDIKATMKGRNHHINIEELMHPDHERDERDKRDRERNIIRGIAISLSNRHRHHHPCLNFNEEILSKGLSRAWSLTELL